VNGGEIKKKGLEAAAAKRLRGGQPNRRRCVMKLEDKSAYLLQKEPARCKRAEKEKND
jgi:hypothetical protein